MGSHFMQYEHDSGVIARWSGGAYIDLGYIDNEHEFHAYDVINVYDYAKGEATISGFNDMREAVDERLRLCDECGEGNASFREDVDNDALCDECYEQRKPKSFKITMSFAVVVHDSADADEAETIAHQEAEEALRTVFRDVSVSVEETLEWEPPAVKQEESA